MYSMVCSAYRVGISHAVHLANLALGRFKMYSANYWFLITLNLDKDMGPHPAMQPTLLISVKMFFHFVHVGNNLRKLGVYHPRFYCARIALKSKTATRQKILPKLIEISLGDCVDDVPRLAIQFHILKSNHLMAMGINMQILVDLKFLCQPRLSFRPHIKLCKRISWWRNIILLYENNWQRFWHNNLLRTQDE